MCRAGLADAGSSAMRGGLWLFVLHLDSTPCAGGIYTLVARSTLSCHLRINLISPSRGHSMYRFLHFAAKYILLVLVVPCSFHVSNRRISSSDLRPWWIHHLLFRKKKVYLGLFSPFKVS